MILYPGCVPPSRNSDQEQDYAGVDPHLPISASWRELEKNSRRGLRVTYSFSIKMKNHAEEVQYQKLCSSSMKLVENIIMQFKVITIAMGILLTKV